MVWQVKQWDRWFLRPGKDPLRAAESLGRIGHDGQLLPPEPHTEDVAADRSRQHTELLKLFGEAMVRAGALADCYRASIVPVQGHDRRATIHVRLFGPLLLSQGPQQQVEAFLERHAGSSGVELADVVWLHEPRSS